MVKMGLANGKKDADGRAIQANTHAGAYGAALSHRLVEPILRRAVVTISVSMSTRDVLNQLCKALSQELAGSIADGSFVDIVAVTGHKNKLVSSECWSEHLLRCRR